MKHIRMVDADELRAHVRFEDLIEPVSEAFQDCSARLADNGLIIMFPGASPASGDVYVKTGVVKGHKVYIVKVSPWFQVNAALGRPQGGFVAVFDSQTGHSLAILNEQHYLSDIRTAAAGSLAARALAPACVTTATVLGAGVQAYWQPQALYRERPFKTLLIWARNLDKAEGLRDRLAPALPKVDIHVETDLEAAVRHSDVLITTTLAREPIVRGDWLRGGQHITAIGADDPTKCELDVTCLKRARVFVDSLDSNAANGDIGRAVRTSQYALDEVTGEIGEVLAGSKIGRLSAVDITLAKFVGLGAQDLVAAEVSLKRLGILSP